MALQLAEYLRSVIDAELPRLQEMSDSQAGLPSRPGGWTKKEELGHLIDSATNNHVRIVRASVEDNFCGPSYDQETWVRVHGYVHLPWRTLYEQWSGYNNLLAHLVEQIPDERLTAPCYIGVSGGQVTLGWVIEDYVVHMQHHLDQILGRENITPYPRAAAAAAL